MSEAEASCHPDGETPPLMTFEWTGDLNDCCACSVGGMWATCEKMSENPDWWFACVSRGGEYLLHTSSDDILPKTGQAARRLCELVMRAEPMWRMPK